MKNKSKDEIGTGARAPVPACVLCFYFHRPLFDEGPVFQASIFLFSFTFLSYKVYEYGSLES